MSKSKKNELNLDLAPDWRIKYVFKPESIFRFSWEIFIALILLFLGFTLPYINAFEPNNRRLSDSIDIASMIIFSVDIIFNFNTGYYDHGLLTRDRLKIFYSYMSFWFWVDFLSTIPIDWIFNAVNSDNKLQSIIKITRILKLFKLVRLAKLRVIIFRIEDQIANEKLIYLMTVAKLLLYIILLAHCIACTMYSISSFDTSPDSLISLILNKSDMQVYKPQDLYISCMYWSITTMAAVGYGDFCPRTTQERLFGLVTMFTSSLVFGAIVGNISALMEKYSMADKVRADTLVSLNHFMKSHSLDSKLRSKARRYIDYAFHNGSINQPDLNELLANLSQPLQEEILLCTHGNILLNCPSFKIFNEAYINRFAKMLNIKVYSPLDSIIKEGQRSDGMFFILKGKAEVFDFSTSRMIVMLRKRSSFGEIGLFTRQSCVSSVVSHDFSELLFLSCADFDLVLEKMPGLKTDMEEIRRSCSEGNYSAINVVCYSCKKLGHIAKHCQAILDDDEHKNKWVNRQACSKLVNIYIYNKERRRKKAPRPIRYDYASRNVIGRKRKVKEVFPHEEKLVRSIKHYFQENIRDAAESDVLITEESILNTLSAKDTARINLILSSSDDDIEESYDEVIRKPKFCNFSTL